MLGFIPKPPIVISTTEEAAIRKMRRLGIDIAEASQPRHLQAEDWDLWSDESRATATKFWTTRRDYLRRQITEVANALSSLLFSDSFKASGVGPVYVVREFPSEDPCSDNRIQLCEVGPPELSHIIENDPYSQSHFVALPTLTLHHLQTLFPDPAEAAAALRMRRLREISGNMSYLAWRNKKVDDNAAKQHGLMLAEISQLETAFPHLEFDKLVACINTSLTN